MDRLGGVDTGGTHAALLEREASCRRLEELVGAALEGRGTLAAVVGAPGEGKTALLGEAGALGERMGLRVWRAHGSDLERAFAFGVVRRLLLPAVTAIDPRERAEVFTGASRLAASVLDLDERAQPVDAFAAQHGLYWLLVALAARESLMLVVDDAHWADEPSLAWLASLPRRIEELGVLVVIATRPPAFDGAGDALAVLLSDPQIPLLRVGPLGKASIAALARLELEAEPDRHFTAACHHATGGNPLAVIELLRDLRRSGNGLGGAGPGQLEDRAPEAIERHVRGRVDRLGPAAVGVAHALAVLGNGAQPRHVATLAGIELQHAGRLIDELTLAGVLARDSELRFEHPLVHAAVRDGIAARRLAALHARAAGLLAGDDLDPEAIAAHLLLADPAADAPSVAGLRAAAGAALRRGSPHSAVIYLQRALAEPPTVELRSAVLGELGRAVFAAFDTSAVEHLQAARERAVDPRERARLDLMLAEVCFYGGKRDRLFAVLEAGLADLGQEDPELTLELRAMRTTALAGLDAGWPAADDAEHERLAALAGADSETGRELQLSLALVGIWRGRATAPETIARVRSAFEERMFERLAAGSATPIAHGLFALIFADELDRAAELASQMMTLAAAHGSPLLLGLASHAHGWAQLRRGALADAEASGRLAVESAVLAKARFAEPITRAPLGETLIERGRLDEAAEVLTGVPSDVQAQAASVFMGTALARLHRARGEREEAIAVLETLGEEATRDGMDNPNVLPWRSELAHVIAAEDPERARELAESELTDARAVVLPRAVGVALRARAASEHGAVRELTLRDAVAVLETSPARLELARALIDLGGHLRRGGRRSEARELLRRALELAHRCAAEPLIELAGDELRAADGRPRNPWLTGAAALTAGELRVARLAASGLSNQQVAETLFVTIKTVEMHLTNAYRKLGSSSRAELPRLLEGEL